MVNPLLLMLSLVASEAPRRPDTSRTVPEPRLEPPPPPKPEPDHLTGEITFPAGDITAQTDIFIPRRVGPYAPERRHQQRPIDRGCKVCGAAAGTNCTNLGAAARKGRTVHRDR